MKITDITTLLLFDPKAPYFQDGTMPPPKPGLGGRAMLFVQVHTDAGTVGLGLTEGERATRAIIHDHFRKLLIGKDPFDIEGLWQQMLWRVRSFGRKGLAFQAISAVDIALWDLKAKALNLPLYKLLGAVRDKVPVYGSGGWTHYTQKELIAEQSGYLEQGFGAVKMKVGKDFGTAEQEDVKRVAAVRKALGAKVPIFIDANNAYRARQAVDLSHRFADLGVAWFEEPVIPDDLDGLAQVRREGRVPVATGELEYTIHGFRELFLRQATDIAQPDVGRCGGITEWMKIAHLAQAFNLPIASHYFAVVHLHLAMCIPNLMIVEVLAHDLHSNPLWYVDWPKVKNGHMAPFPDRPGLGIELRPDTVKKHAID